MSNIKRIPSENPVIDRIEALLAEQNKQKKDLLSYLGLGDSVFTKWRYNNGKSYLKYISEISDYFGVSQSYILSGDNDEFKCSDLTKDEQYLINRYRLLDPHKQKVLIEVANSMT